MKHIYCILFIILTSNLTSGQELEIDEIDEFTKSHVQTTSWETLTNRSPLYSYARLRKIDNRYVFDVKLMGGSKVFSVDEGNNLLLKLENEEIIEIFNKNYELSNYGEGAIGIIGSQSLGVFLKCSISHEQLQKLRQKKLEKIRLNSSNGYREAEVKSKQAEKFMKMMNLIN